MTLHALLKREAAVDGDLKLARRNPAEDVVRAFHELFASDGVVVQLRAGQVTRLVDEAKRRERRDGAGGVTEGNEDTAASQDVDGGFVRGETDAIDDSLDTFALGDFHHARHEVDRGVVFVGRTRRFIVHDELIDARGARDVLLALRTRSDDLVSSEFGHLRRPLARARTGAVNQHPLARLHQPGVRRVREVVRRHSLHPARNRDVQRNRFRHRDHLARRHRRVLRVRLKHGRVAHAVADLDALRDGFVARRRDVSTTLLTTDEG